MAAHVDVDERGLFRFPVSLQHDRRASRSSTRTRRISTFLDLGPDSALVSVLLTQTPDVYDWTSVTPSSGPAVALRSTHGVGALSPRTARRRRGQPSPQRRRSCTVVTPTPQPGQTGQSNVRLQLGEGNNWDIYTGKSSDPVSGGGRNTYITGVKNTSNKRIGLIHVDQSGKRTGPVFVKATEVSDAFDGMLVAGDWEARMTGSQSEAPARVNLEVRYEVR